MFGYKKISKPINSDTKEVDAVQLWIVQWISRHGSFHGQIEKQFQAFTSEELANSYANDLRKAFKFIRHTSETEVSVIKDNTKTGESR